ncbi:hypothetical protein LCGC14_1418670 [marine sediment metagenome]|uniref:Uncharacterized protein n=1 Tax=marine sediment metagenome TaxID=412755 RepID=A0A0F9M7I0_9ZZZZ
MAEVQLQVGQVYQDNDPRAFVGGFREQKRQFRIVALNDRTQKALVENTLKAYGFLGRQTEISYQRLQMNNRRGYQLV